MKNEAPSEAIRPGLPPWVVLHMPHDSTFVPPEVRDQFVLTDEGLQEELRLMTDHFTEALFTACVGEAVVVKSPVSRLVVDVERFADDAEEPMAARGMGAIYRVRASLAPLRRHLSDDERAALMQAWYRPHHDRLEQAVATALDRHGRCLVLDCHSFPEQPLPYEQGEGALVRPDICIGTDGFHTSEAVAKAFVGAFRGAGWSVAIDQPFAGAVVPASRYGRDRRVGAVMVEVNRRLYLREADATPRAVFEQVAGRVGPCCVEAIGAALAGRTASPR